MGHMGILHSWAVYRRAQVIYGVAIEKKKVLKEGVNSGKSDTPWSRTHTCGPRDHPITAESGNHLVGTNKPPGVLTDGSWTAE